MMTRVSLGMVSSLFEDMSNWIGDVVPQMADLFAREVLEGLSPDLTIFHTYFPFLGTAYTIFVWTGMAILVVSLMMNLLRAYAGPVLDNVEAPIAVLFRALIFMVLTFFISELLPIALRFAMAPYNAMWNLPLPEVTEPDFARLIQLFWGNFEQGSNVIVTILLGLVMFFVIAFNYFKLLLEIVERYIVMNVLALFAPLATGLGGSTSTANVFKSWVRMFGSSLFMLTINVWFVRGFNSALGSYYETHGIVTLANGSVVGGSIMWMFATLALLKTGQNIDSIFASLGLSTAQTGRGLMAEALAGVAILGRGIQSTTRNLSSGGSKGKALKTEGNAFTRGRLAAKAGVGAAGGDKVTSFAKNKKGTVVQSEMVDTSGNRTSVRKTNLKDNPAPRGAHYLEKDGKGNTWAVEATGANAGSYLGPQFGENSANHRFQTSANPEYVGQFNAQDIAQKYQEEYKNALLSGESPTDARATAQAATRERIGESARAQALAEGATDERANVQAEKAMYGYDSYIEETRNAFGSSKANSGTFFQNDEANPGHIKAYGTDAMGNGVEQDYYLASAYDRPQGAHELFTDNNGNEWYSVDTAQVDTSKASNRDYFTSSYMPEINDAVDGHIERVDARGADDGYYTIRASREQTLKQADGTYSKSTAIDEYRAYDASRYTAPQGDYKTIQDHAGHSYYVSKGQETVSQEAVRTETGSMVIDDKGSNVTRNVVKHKHSTPRKAEPPKKKRY